MKRYLLVALLFILILPDLFGEIRNGYERDLPKLKTSLENLKRLLAESPNLRSWERKRLKQKIESLMDMMVYSELTVKLLKQFKDIAPALYNEIDTLKDNNGRIIDVYVKFITREQATFESSGTVSFLQSETDKHSCVSSYGEGTVAVMILIVNNSLQVLSHEFGHLQYLIPNLATYVEYYKRTYGRGMSADRLGHRTDDPSGNTAFMFQRLYRQGYLRHRRDGGSILISPYALAIRTRRDLFKDTDNSSLSMVVKGW